MAREGIVHDALVIYNKNTHQLDKKCRICKADLAEAELIRAWESGGRKNYILACPGCGRFNLFWRKKYDNHGIPNRMVG